jgi:hypothetical protein
VRQCSLLRIFQQANAFVLFLFAFCNVAEVNCKAIWNRIGTEIEPSQEQCRVRFECHTLLTKQRVVLVLIEARSHQSRKLLPHILAK